MPGITGQVVILTVRDAHRSATWYRDLLGMEETSRHIQPDGDVVLVHLVEPRNGVELALVHHQSVQAAFAEFRTGLDHLVPGGSPRRP